jgi:hypothetical protein
MSWVKVRLVDHNFLRNHALKHFTLKINQFHWHATDSQSFPLEIPGFSEVAQKGAYSSSSIYSPEDIADIVSYAGAVSSSRFPSWYYNRLTNYTAGHRRYSGTFTSSIFL